MIRSVQQAQYSLARRRMFQAPASQFGNNSIMCGIVGYVGKQSAAPSFWRACGGWNIAATTAPGVASWTGSGFGLCARKVGKIDEGLAKLSAGGTGCTAVWALVIRAGPRTARQRMRIRIRISTSQAKLRWFTTA